MKTYYLNSILILLVLFVMQSIAAQPMIPKRSYMHLTGQIGKKYEITLNLVKINDSLYGDYHCRALTKDPNTISSSPINDDNLPVVCGRMKPDGSFSLGIPFSKKLPHLIGQLTRDQRVTGIWEDENGKDPFEIREKYSEGSLQFNVSYLKGSMPLVKKPGSPAGSIEMTLLTPVESTNPVLSDSLKKIIIGKFMKRPVRSNNPETSLNLLKETYYEKYFSANEALYNNKAEGPNLNWESLEFMHVLYNDNHLLTFYIISYAFTGGAHGLETHEFYVIDLKSGKILALTDILSEGFEKELTMIITQKFKDLNSLKPTRQLSEAGFFTDTVKPNDNFYITGEGIGFLYNHYEIAPYASSPNNCFLPFSELEAMIKPDGVLKSILQ
jgi:hypothetical protein